MTSPALDEECGFCFAAFCPRPFTSSISTVLKHGKQGIMTALLDVELPANRKEITFEWLLKEILKLNPKTKAADCNALWGRIHYHGLTRRVWGFLQCNYRTSDDELLFEYFRLFSKESLDYKEAEDGLQCHRTVVFKEMPVQVKATVSRRADQRRALNFALHPAAV